PALEEFQKKVAISVTADPATCKFHLFVGPWSTFSDCDQAKDFVAKKGISFKTIDAKAGDPPVIKIGDKEISGKDLTNRSKAAPIQKQIDEALAAAGYPAKADLSKVNWIMTLLILVVMVIYVTMVYGPIAAFLVELFPTKIRYTSMSLPYHIGNGWFGGMLPL